LVASKYLNGEWALSDDALEPDERLPYKTVLESETPPTEPAGVAACRLSQVRINLPHSGQIRQSFNTADPQCMQDLSVPSESPVDLESKRSQASTAIMLPTASGANSAG
jgi:hypothetical protein